MIDCKRGSKQQFEQGQEILEEKIAEDGETMYFARVHHYGWWVLHNCVAHPLMGFLPFKIFFDFHDWTSEKLDGE